MIVASCIVSDGSLKMKKSDRQANDSKRCQEHNGDGASAPSSVHFVDVAIGRPSCFSSWCCGAVGLKSISGAAGAVVTQK